MRKICCITILMLSVLALLSCGANAGDVDQKYIRKALSLARQAMQQGNEPFGAVLVKDGRIIMQAGNTIHTDDNVTHHAETNLLAKAYRKLGIKAAIGSTIYSSCEPCAMCCGAIYLFKIKRLVYGLSAPRLSALSGWKMEFPSRKFFQAAQAEIQITGPVLEEESLEVFREYFKKHPLKRHK
ncbi:MAG: nucleoside deaminase [Desulfarculaceae bacterium]